MDYNQSDELAQLQKLSNEYSPEAEGPLVSERISSSAITTEYANGDPVYQIKTAALPQKYSFYRTCRGDGHCGWRAVAFSYFEALQKTGSKQKFFEEETRLRSLANLFLALGHPEHVYEDFAEETYSLLRTIANTNDDGETLLATFNDYGTSMSIITHIKLLTSAWIQTHPEQFAPYVVPQTIQEYCQRSIEAANCEIENVGLSALADVLVKPAGFAVEVLYLDRSPGEEVNTYRFDLTDQHGTVLPASHTLRLLYRPGHYDILYRPEDIPQPIEQPPVFVNLTSTMSEHRPDFHGMAGRDDNLAIPGMSFAFPHQTNWAFNPLYDLPSAPVPTVSQAVPVPAYVPLPVPHQELLPPQSIPMEQPISPPVSQPQPSSIGRNGPFRPCTYEFEINHSSVSLPVFQTSQFKNSHFNVAHYNNPDFQPEAWNPNEEYKHTERSRRNRSQ
ncbi:cysteine proteinase [Aulographum hederae CBS 113979]|uniref:ubiquitinyl hydrolase 1 n=1 Tax=Aulographum hederae CBS 113979 TaxID=1176131 RepID=A0A6G1GPM7_9PEZI|nr:cysteine proteinase [Aulographum hederae CBS 113979]